MRTAERRAWLRSLGVGLAAAIFSLVLLRQIGNYPGVGPADVMGALLVFALVTWLVLPRWVAPAHRLTRALVAWSALMLFWAIVETAHVCGGAASETCKSVGEPFRPFLVWAAGFAALNAARGFVVGRHRR